MTRRHNIPTGLIAALIMSISLVDAADAKLTSYQLGNHILAFHDTYQEAVSEAIDKIASEALSPASRTYLQTIKVFYTQASIDIATASDPATQLIDMMIMLRLQRLVWKNTNNTLVIRSQADRMSGTLLRLEQELLKTAKRVFTQEDIKRVQEIAENWRKQNPDRQYIAFVRFTDLGDSEDKAKLEKIVAGGGLFSSISEANAELEETRHALEKALFVAHHMPILLEWQAELFMYKVLSTGEIQDMLVQTERTTNAAERISLVMEKFPDDVSGILDNNKDEFLRLASSIEATSSNLRTISEQLSPLFLKQDSNDDGEIDLLQVENILKKAYATSESTLNAIKAFSELHYDEEVATHMATLMSTQVKQIDAVLEQRINQLSQRALEHRERIFYLLLALCFLFPVIFFSGYIIARRTADKNQLALINASKVEIEQ
jgi:hypothetical protein